MVSRIIKTFLERAWQTFPVLTASLAHSGLRRVQAQTLDLFRQAVSNINAKIGRNLGITATVHVLENQTWEARNYTVMFAGPARFWRALGND